jgi:hypothetical protein
MLASNSIRNRVQSVLEPFCDFRPGSRQFSPAAAASLLARRLFEESEMKTFAVGALSALILAGSLDVADIGVAAARSACRGLS